MFPEGLVESSRHQLWLWTYCANFYLAARGSWALPGVGHFWSLAVEEHFYFLWPLAVFLLQRRTLLRVSAGVIVGSAALRILLLLSGVNELATYVLTPCRLDALCVGAALALLVREAGGVSPIAARARRASPWVLASLVLIIAWHIATPRLAWMSLPLRGSGWALLFGVLVICAVDARPGTWLHTIFCSRPLSWLGKYSYGLYVFHGIVAYYLIEVHCRERVLGRVGNGLIAIALVAALGTLASITVAWVSFNFFESKLLSFKSRFSARVA